MSGPEAERIGDDFPQLFARLTFPCGRLTKSHMRPTDYTLQYSAEDIRLAVHRVGVELSEWAAGVEKSSGRDIIAVPVLRGGIYFFADLMREIHCSVEMAPVRTRSYVDEVNAAQRDRVEIQLDGLDVSGRAILLVDDICDSGRTMRVLKDHLLARGATEVRSAVLIKRVHDACVFEPDWSAFHYAGPEWFVGYGMEDGNRWTNLPDIYTIRPRG